MTANQRHYYRILDAVALEYREVPAAMTGKRPEDFFEMTAGFQLLTALNQPVEARAAARDWAWAAGRASGSFPLDLAGLYWRRLASWPPSEPIPRRARSSGFIS